MQKIRAKKERYLLKKYLYRIATLAGVCLCFLMFINIYMGSFIRVEGDSMEPTLAQGELGFVYKNAYAKNPPERFDVIVFNLEAGQEHYIKRIIGMPGETVRIDVGSIFINEARLLDPVGTSIADSYSVGEGVTLGPDEYFVLGDNRETSYDSRQRSFGAVKAELILGAYGKL